MHYVESIKKFHEYKQIKRNYNQERDNIVSFNGLLGAELFEMELMGKMDLVCSLQKVSLVFFSRVLARELFVVMILLGWDQF